MTGGRGNCPCGSHPDTQAIGSSQGRVLALSFLATTALYLKKATLQRKGANLWGEGEGPGD